MAETIETLIVKLDANVQSLTRGLDRGAGEAKRGSKKILTPIQKMGRQIDAEFKGIAAAAGRFGNAFGALGPVGLAAGAAFGGAAIALNAAMDAARQAVEQFSNLANTADKLGIGVERLQELRFASEQVGVSANTLDIAFQRFTRRLGEAAQGSGELKGILEQYDIAVRNADGTTRSATDVMGDLAESIKGAESEQEQLRIAFKAFDSEGAALVNLLRGGKQGLDDYAAAAREAGAVIDKEMVEKGRQAGDKINRLQQQQTALMNQTGILFADWLVRWEEIKTEVLATVRDIASAFSDEIPTESMLPARIREVEEAAAAAATKLGNYREARDRMLASGKQVPDQLTGNIIAQAAEVERLTAKIIDLKDLLKRMKGEDGVGEGGGAEGGGNIIPQATLDKASAEIAKLQAQFDDLRRTDLGRDTFGSFRAADVLDDDGNVRPGMEQQAEEIALLQRKIAEIEKANAVQERATEIVAALRTAEEQQAAELAELNDLYADGRLELEEYERAVAAVNEKYDGLGKAAKRVIEDIKTEHEKLADEIERLNEMLERGLITTEQHGKAVEKAREKYDEATDALEEMAKSGVDELRSSFEDFARGTKDAGDVILDVLFSIGEALADVLVQQAKAQNSSGGGGGDLFGGIFQGIAGLFGGAFAKGGRPPAGKASLVGEKGPELFVPDRPGTIIPNDVISRGIARMNEGKEPLRRALAAALPHFAGGGDPPVGMPSIVGERGPELFIPKIPGTIIPNHAAGGMLRGGGGGGVTVNQSITVSGLGIDDVERRLAPRFQQMRQQTLQDVQRAHRDNAGFLA
ncbi:MAG: hypothetical protein P1U65_07545 [Minwuia sp.]|nr:hypothetical protein [Minwuia sp.]